MTGKKTLIGFGFCSAAGTPQQSQTPKSPAQQLHPFTTSTRCFLAFCFCMLLPPSQRSRWQAKCRPWSQAWRKMVEASFQRMARSPIAHVLHKFSQAPGTPIYSKPSHSHELSATNHKVIYIKTNNVTHSERMTSHHYHKFTVIEKTSNWQISLHAYNEMVSIRENWRTNEPCFFLLFSYIFSSCLRVAYALPTPLRCFPDYLSWFA